MVLNSLAWLLSTCQDSKYRDGKIAVFYAEKACNLAERKDEHPYLATLAAAYAESGNYEKAVEIQEQAILRLETGPPEQIQVYREEYFLHLNQYKENKPYRDNL